MTHGPAPSGGTGTPRGGCCACAVVAMTRSRTTEQRRESLTLMRIPFRLRPMEDSPDAMSVLLLVRHEPVEEQRAGGEAAHTVDCMDDVGVAKLPAGALDHDDIVPAQGLR